MSGTDRTDAAIAWHVRLSDPAAPVEAWVEFTDWLEADPANGEAYDILAMADAKLSDTLAISRADPGFPQNDNEAFDLPWYRRRGALAIAASAVLALLVSPLLMQGRDLEAIETRPGETRVIALKDGSRIDLNGGTRVLIDRKTDRFARLEAGEALFTVRHDAANRFTVEAGDASLHDIGTVFNVRHDDLGLDVAVSEGAVRYDHKAEAITVSAGNRLSVAANGRNPRVSRVDNDVVGSWQQGRLAYQNAALAMVAIDLSRALGTSVTATGAVADRRFSGVIQLGSDQAALFHRVEVLLGVKARKTDTGWELAP